MPHPEVDAEILKECNLTAKELCASYVAQAENWKPEAGEEVPACYVSVRKAHDSATPKP